MTARQISTTEGDFQITGEGFKPKGEILFQGKPLGDDDLSRHQNNLGFRLAAACLSLCHNSQIKKVDGLWEALGDPTDSACAVAGWKINGDVQKFAQNSRKFPKNSIFFLKFCQNFAKICRHFADFC